MITAFFGGIASMFMKGALFFSHLKLIAAWLTGNVHIIVHHFVYKHVWSAVQPALRFSPV